MTDSYRAELLDQIDRIFKDELCGRATKSDVTERLTELLPKGAAAYYVRRGVSQVVSAYFREQGSNGLPQAPEANSEGEHVQFELLDANECGYVYHSYMSRADANKAKAVSVRNYCLDTYGVDVAGFSETA